MKEFRKRFWLEIALCTSFLSFFQTLGAYSSDGTEVLLAAAESPAKAADAAEKDTYTINFNNVSIIEFIRFASKLTGLNFVFEEANLQFTVTVVSEDPVTAKNVMSALAQVLRMHDLILLEQGSNVLITNNDKVRQIPTIISSDLPDSKAENAVLVTRVFRIKNANANTLASIIRPMTSSAALIEVSNETRQLIVTDITTNVDKVAQLLASLDSPHSPLEIDTYIVKNIAPDELISLSQRVLTPFAEGNPLIFVPQSETNSVFIVSTPHLIERALTVMEDLDHPPKPMVMGPLAKKTVFIYKIQNATPDELIAGLKQIATQMKGRGVIQPSLEQAINGLTVAEDTNSIIFLADEETISRLKDILASLDSPMTGKETFFIYKIQRAKENQIAISLDQMKNRLEAIPHPDEELIHAIESLSWIKETNSLIFTGTPAALQKLKDILPTFDVITTAELQAKSTFLIYNPQNRTGDELYTAMVETGSDLKKAGLADKPFLQTIDSINWTPSTNSLIFTGDPQSLERIHAMLIAMDSPGLGATKATEVFIYKPQYASPERIEQGLQALLPSLKASQAFADQNLAQAVQAMQWNATTQSFMVTTDPATIDRLKALLATIDSQGEVTGQLAQGFYLYKLQAAQGDVVIDELKHISAKLPTSNLQNQNLIKAIKGIEWVRSNNSLLITGSPDAIEQVKTLIVDFDVSSGAPTGAQAFFIYKSKFLPAKEIQVVLSDLASDLKAAGLTDTQFSQTLETVRFVESTNSLLFTGSQDSIDKVKELLTTIDTSEALSSIQKIGNLTFYLYKLQYADGDQFLLSMKAFAAELQKSNPEDQQVAEAINSMKLIRENNSVLFTGTQEALQRIEEIVKKFDVGTGPSPVERAAATFVIYNPKYLNGEELIGILCDFKHNLKMSGVSDPAFFDVIDNLKWIPKTSTLLVSGDEAAIARTQALLEKFDIPSSESAVPSIESIDNTSFLVYKLQYHTGIDIQGALKQVAANLTRGSTPNIALAEAIESLQWIQVTNSLLATGQADILVKMKDLIQNLDIPLRQVFIEVLVITTTLSNAQNFGLQWASQFKYFDKTIFQTGNLPGTGSAIPTLLGPPLQAINATTTPTNTTLPFSTGFDLGVIGDIIMHKGRSFISLGSLLNAIQIDNDNTVVINQKIITQDNRQSTIFVGNNIPYTGAIVTNSQSNTTTTSNIEYRDVGVTLTITPMLGENDIITLDIVQDLSQVVTGASATNSQVLTGITTSHTHMETRVHVPDSKFLVLSGMINDQKTHFRTAIPCLGSLPVIGALFSENDRQNQKANVIIFVRPQIVNTIEEYKQLTERQEWLFKDQARLPVLKEEFDEGLDTIKLPEDE